MNNNNIKYNIRKYKMISEKNNFYNNYINVNSYRKKFFI